VTCEKGDSGVKWRVTYNAAFGEPGPLAYKLDTLIINRRLDEAPGPLPEIIRVGSLSEIARELGLSEGKTLLDIKRAFHQNASAYIVARVRYKTRSGKERWREIGWTRYAVLFTGDELPDGRIADAVYLIPNTTYRDILNEAEVRPLDYEYLRELPPGPQRFYELLSFQMYGAIANARPRAKLMYGAYCAVAPQVRYPDWEHVRKQMYKVHAPHRASGYISKVDFEPTTDAHGAPDWAMLYTPGPKAHAEFQAFTKRERRPGGLAAALPASDDIDVLPASARGAVQVSLPFDAAPADPELIALLADRGIDERTARQLLAATVPGQDVRRQIEYADERIAKDKRIESPTGYLVDMLRKNRPVPKSFTSRRPVEKTARGAAAPGTGAGGGGYASGREPTPEYLAASAAAYDAFLATISPEERSRLQENAEAILRHETRGASLSTALRDRAVRGAVREVLEREGRFRFPTPEVWRGRAMGSERSA
jgi:hypothetical protein